MMRRWLCHFRTGTHRSMRYSLVSPARGTRYISKERSNSTQRTQRPYPPTAEYNGKDIVEGTQTPARRRILGLPPKGFACAIIVCVLAIGFATVLGEIISYEPSSNSATQKALAFTPTPTPTPTARAGETIQTATITLPSSTVLSDCPLRVSSPTVLSDCPLRLSLL
jgi:hypothetical protein